MKAVFIADAHLDGRATDGYRYLLRFFDSGCGGADELFILGDFFDFWFAGEKAVYPGFAPIVEKLLEMRRRGTHISFFEGNHDFFLGDYFEPHGIRVYPECAAIDLDGKKMFLSHGDMVNTANRGYRALRKLLRSGIFYRTQKHMPSPLLWHIARAISGMSRSCEWSDSDELNERITAFAGEKIDDGADAVILGHFHSPRFEQRVVDGRVRTIAVLGDWIRHHTYLVYENGQFTMKSGIPADSSVAD